MSLTDPERSALAAALARDGWAVTPPLVPQLVIDRLVADLAPLARDGRGGGRDLLDASDAARALAASAPVRAVAAAVLGDACFAVRGLLFDGTPGASWKAVYHQDLTVAVRARASLPGWGPWSEKAGVPHVQPPAELLERMLAVRIHLDDCGPENGPVCVVTGSHRAGRLSPAAIDAWRAGAGETPCLVERGGVLALRPLLLQASSAATAPGHRRVVHLEFAAEDLPAPLEWHARVG